MHNYLKSVGFEQLTNTRQEKILLDSILQQPDRKKLISNPDDTDSVYAELTGEYAPGIGVRIIGEYDEYEQFRMDNYYPFYEGGVLSTRTECYIARKLNNLTYSGLCEDDRIGVSIIFHVINTLDCISRGEPVTDEKERDIYFSGLCTEGRVLLPTIYTDEVLANSDKKSRRSEMVAEAKGGAMDALEALVLEDIDNLSNIGARLQKEDVMSIVETSFVPYGMETELYKVLGIIKKVDSFINPVLKERIYCLRLICNEMPIDVCINEKNLSGEPLPGRRFRGILWLQGLVK